MAEFNEREYIQYDIREALNVDISLSPSEISYERVISPEISNITQSGDAKTFNIDNRGFDIDYNGVRLSSDSAVINSSGDKNISVDADGIFLSDNVFNKHVYDGIKISSDINISPDEFSVSRDTPRIEISTDIPLSGNTGSVENKIAAELNTDIPLSPDTASADIAMPVPDINTDIQVSGDTPDVHIVKQTGNIDTGISLSPQSITSEYKPDIEFDTNIQISDDTPDIHTIRQVNNIDTDIPVSDDTPNIHTPRITQAVDTDILLSPQSITSEYKPNVQMDDDIQIADSTFNIHTPRTTRPINTDVPTSPNKAIITTNKPDIIIDDNIDISENDKSVYLQNWFNGKWVSYEDELVIGNNNYSNIENFRYLDNKLVGVGGFTRINTATTGLDLRNGIQLRTNYDTPSYIICQGEDNDGNMYLIDNTTAVPDAGNFDTYYVFEITPSNNKLNFTLDIVGTPTDIYLDDGNYSGTELASEIESKMNAEPLLTDGTMITFDVTFDEETRKFTIDTGDPTYSISLDYSSSTAADMIGFSKDAEYAQSITSDTAVLNETPLYSETSGATDARMSKTPDGGIIVCDSKENLIYNGDEIKCSAFLVGGTDDYIYKDDLSDYTENVINTAREDVDISFSTKDYLIGTTRYKISGIYFNLGTNGSGTSSIMTVEYYNGDEFVNLSDSEDGTSVGGVTLAQSGWVTFTAPTDAKPYLINGLFLYFYKVTISASLSTHAEVNTITLKAPPQNIVDIWDGTYRTPSLVRVNLNTNTSQWKDYTYEAAIESNQATQYLIDMNSFDDTYGAIDLVFDEPMAGVKIIMWVKNTDASGKIQIWVPGIGATPTSRDSTAGSSQNKAFSATGFALFPDNSTVNFDDEYKKTVDGVKGYVYTLSILSGATDISNNTEIDLIQGIPRQRKINNPYIFSFQYRNRLLLCGDIDGNERNRIDYSAPNSVSVFNGTNASGINNENSIYIGDEEPLTGGVSVFNQYGISVEEIALLFKNLQTYILKGSSPDDFSVHCVSNSIGCPAPLTIASIEAGVQTNDGRLQNIVIWLSSNGPVMFINNSIVPIPGIEEYFDRCHDNYINHAAISNARGWYDPTYGEYNLTLPTGSSTTNNVWLAYDVRRNKWFKRTPTNDFPNGGFIVEDTYGNQYTYGYNSDGYLLRMEDGLLWSESDYEITNTVTTSDILPFESMWDESALRKFKLIHKADDDGKLTISYFNDGVTSAMSNTNGFPDGGEDNLDLMGNTGYRYRNRILHPSGTANSFLVALSHKFKIDISGCTNIKPELIGWGAEFVRLRENDIDKDDLE